MSISTCKLIYTGWSKKKFMNRKKKAFYQKRDIFLALFLFLLKDNSFKVSKLKIAIEVIQLSIWPQKCLFLKRL